LPTLIFFFFTLGDEIPKEDCTKLLEELCEKEDEDGFIPYRPFVDKLCGK
jgi:Ca2+-binding EF-hand superfamily protein